MTERQSFFTRWSRVIRTMKLRDHEWVEIKFGVRQCSRCGQRDYLGAKKFPQIGEPKYSWMFERTPCRRRHLGE